MLEDLKRLGAYQGLAVDEKTGCAAHAQGTGGICLSLDESGVFTQIEAVVECSSVQPELLGEAFQIFFVESTAILA